MKMIKLLGKRFKGVKRGVRIMDYGFCSILSKYRLYQGMALYNSLSRNLFGFNLFILCMDDETFFILKRINYPNVVPISLHDIENQMLLNIKNGRTLN